MAVRFEETGSLGMGIVAVRLAAEGDEVLGATDEVGVRDDEVEEANDDDVDDEGSGGAATKMSFWAPLAHPYRQL